MGTCPSNIMEIGFKLAKIEYFQNQLAHLKCVSAQGSFGEVGGTARNYVYKIPATVMRAETHNNIVSQ